MNRPTLTEVDVRIAELRATVDRITTNLADLDGDLTRQMLDASTTLRGRTEEAWTAARGGLEHLWQGQLALRDVIERIDAARGRRTTLSRSQLQDVADLLDGTSATLVTGTSRSLTEGPIVTVDLTVDALVADMSTTYDAITAVVDRVGEVWSGVGPALADLDAQVVRLEDAAANSGERAPNELAQARRAIRDTEDLSRCDPLGLGDDAVTVIERMVDRARASLADATAARQELDAESADVRVAIDLCLEAVARVRTVCAEVAPRIAGSASWSTELDRIGREAVALASEVDGAATPGLAPIALRHRLAEVGNRAEALRQEARALDRQATECLATRDELRGRLDAYRAKAAALGRAEDLELDQLYGRVRDALYEAPCDLERSAVLADDYQRAIRSGAMGED